MSKTCVCHRLGTAEFESALVAHEAVAEAAVVGFPHDIKGTGICAYSPGLQRRSGSRFNTERTTTVCSGIQ